MKLAKKVLALALAAVLALMMLTACDDGGTGAVTTPKNYGEIVETALNAARKEYNLPEVKLDKSLTEEAEKQKNHVSGLQYVTINGQKYKVVFIEGGTRGLRGMTVEELKKTYCNYIRAHQNSTLDYVSSSQEYAGVEELAYIGLWTGNEKNGLIDFCVVGTIPA